MTSSFDWQTLAPGPVEPAAKHLGDVLLAPSLDDLASDVVALRILGGEDVADLDLAGLARLLLCPLLGGQVILA